VRSLRRQWPATPPRTRPHRFAAEHAEQSQSKCSPSVDVRRPSSSAPRHVPKSARWQGLASVSLNDWHSAARPVAAARSPGIRRRCARDAAPRSGGDDAEPGECTTKLTRARLICGNASPAAITTGRDGAPVTPVLADPTASDALHFRLADPPHVRVSPSTKRTRRHSARNVKPAIGRRLRPERCGTSGVGGSSLTSASISGWGSI